MMGTRYLAVLVAALLASGAVAEATVNLAGFDMTLAYTATDIPGDPEGASDMEQVTVSRSL